MLAGHWFQESIECRKPSTQYLVGKSNDLVVRFWDCAWWEKQPILPTGLYGSLGGEFLQRALPSAPTHSRVNPWHPTLGRILPMRKMPVPPGHQMDPANMGPSRLLPQQDSNLWWTRWRSRLSTSLDYVLKPYAYIYIFIYYIFYSIYIFYVYIYFFFIIIYIILYTYIILYYYNIIKKHNIIYIYICIYIYTHQKINLHYQTATHPNTKILPEYRIGAKWLPKNMFVCQAHGQPQPQSASHGSGCIARHHPKDK